MLACNGISGKFSCKYDASPKSWIIIASTPRLYADNARETASLNSSFLIKVFKARWTETFLNLAYFIASNNSVLSKLVAFARALKDEAPRYTASAPFCTADFKHSKSPNRR